MTDIKNDKPGTVRVSPDGVVAVRTDPAHGSQTGYVWALSKAHNHNYWVSDEHVQTWPAIYKPPVPVGTVMYRKFEDPDPFSNDDNLFEVVVMTNKGWIWVNQNGAYNGPEPVVNDNGDWTTVELLP